MASGTNESYKRRRHTRLTRDQVMEIQRLAEQGASLDRIATRFSVPKTTIYYHTKNQGRKMTRMNSNALNETEQGYLVGMFVGDEYLNIWFDQRRHRRRFAVKIILDRQRDQDIADYVQSLFAKAGKRTARFPERTNLLIRATSKEFAEYLSEHVRYIGRAMGQPSAKILVNNEKWGQDFKLGFISGVIDSDGHIHHDKDGTKQYLAEIKTANLTLKEQILRILRTLGMDATEFLVQPHKGAYSKRSIYRIHILKKGIQRNRSRLNSVKLSRQLHRT